MAKKIMRAFKINEISGVTKPAQGGARMVLMKSANEVTKFEKGVHFGASDFAYVPDPKKSDTWKCRLSDVPGGEASSDAINDILLDLQKKEYIPVNDLPEVIRKVRDVWKKLNPDKSELPGVLKEDANNPNPKETTMTPEEKAALEKAQQEAQTAKADLAKANKMAELTDAEKEYHKGLATAEADAFLAKPKEDRQKMIDAKKSADAEKDPVVYKSADGREFRKSADPELVAMAKRLDESEKVTKAEREARLDGDLKKRAAEDLKFLPGDEATKVALLKAADAISDEALRKSAHASLKAQNDQMAKAFVTKGAAGEANTGQEALDTLAKKHAEDHKVSFAKAMTAVLETEEGARLYNEAKAK